MTIQTKNFNPRSDPKLLCTCGHQDCNKTSVSQDHLNRIQLVRDYADRPLKVNSGGRCQNHPSEIHRTNPADHQKGYGVDIAVNGGLERGEIVSLGIKAGCNAIGVAKTFIHLGYRPELEKDDIIMWVY